MEQFDLKPEITRLHNKLDTVIEKVEELKVTAAVNTQQLAEHMRRTVLNEEAVKVITETMKPVSQHVANVNFLGKLAMAAVAVGSFIVGLLKVFGGK